MKFRARRSRLQQLGTFVVISRRPALGDGQWDLIARDCWKAKGELVEKSTLTLASKTCLVIDDDPDFAAFVQKVAEGIGIRARALLDPTQLEQALTQDAPDVITLDMDMPGRHGLEVLSELAVRHLDDRVIIISGTPPENAAAPKPRIGTAHVTAVLTKPIRKRDLEFALAIAIERQRAEILGHG